MSDYSVSPAGEKYLLPKKEDYAAEFERISSLADEAREQGKEIVVVMGVGFVGAVMAAIVADTVDKERCNEINKQRIDIIVLKKRFNRRSVLFRPCRREDVNRIVDRSFRK